MTAEIENGNVEQVRARQIKYIEDTPNAAIAIRKRVDALKLMVNDRHFDERVQIAGVIIIDEDFEPSHKGFNLTRALRRHIDGFARAIVLQLCSGLRSEAIVSPLQQTKHVDDDAVGDQSLCLA